MGRKPKIDPNEPLIKNRSKRLHSDWSGRTADEWIETFEALKTEYAEYEQYGSVTYQVRTEYYYGDEIADLFVSYYEPETKQEIKQRLDDDERRKKWREKEYKALKKEFEGK